LQGRCALASVWWTPAGGASPYANRWPRPVNFMRMLGGDFRTPEIPSNPLKWAQSISD